MEEVKSSPEVVIDAKALDIVRDIALKMLHDDRGPARPNVYLAHALHQYIENQGGTPGFKVTL